MPSVASTPTTRSSWNAGSSRTTDRPLRVETAASGARANRSTLPPAVSAIAYGGGGRRRTWPSPLPSPLAVAVDARRRSSRLHQPAGVWRCFAGSGRQRGSWQTTPTMCSLVLEGELLLDRLAVAGRHRDVVDPEGVGDPPVGEERERLPGPGAVDPADPVVVADPDAGDVGERLLPLRPAVAGDDHPGVLVDDVVFLAELHRRRGALDPRPPRLAVGLGDLLQLVPDDLPARRLVGEQRLDLRGPLPLLRQLVEDVLDLQLAQAVELRLEDRVGLDLGEAEPGDQLGGGVGLAVAVADDPDRLVEVVEDDREAFEDVDPVEQVLQLVLQPAGDDLEPEVEEVLEDRS